VTTTIAYLRRACGEEGVAQMLAIAGEDAADLPSANEWISLDRVIALADAAALVVGTPDVGRLIGEELFASNVADGLDQMMRSAGGPAEAAQMLTALGSHMAGAWTLEVTEVGDHSVEITSTAAAPSTTPFFCSMGVGYYAKVPEVFGMKATAVHPECMVRGDSRCHYIVRWTEPEQPSNGPRFNFVTNLEKLQSVAAQLASSDNPAEVVNLATELAPGVNAGRRFLVSADLGHGNLIVAHSGFDDLDQVDIARDRIERDDINSDDDEPRVCVAPLATARGTYGWLASFHPPRSPINWLIERPLNSFAHHVASALEAAMALDTARRDRDTAHTLATFARELAGAATATEVADLIESTLAGSDGCVDARVWILDRDDQVFRPVGTSMTGGHHLIPLRTDVSLLETRVTVDSDELVSLHPGVASIVQSTVVPLVARSSVLGFVAIGRCRAVDATPDELERFEAIVDQAALAFDVVGLLADLRKQARHDPLSGLANRKLLAERAGLAMAQARRSGRQVGLLFIDLDRFKLVNDEFGHSAGDEVICQVADRLREIVRTQDTVARLGGDEFVVLLTECDDLQDAVTAGHRVSAVMQEPFRVAGEQVEVSATVGVFAAHPGELTWHALVDRADAAMYLGKQQGRNAVTTI
jgi:diguanylate cyclase (GGDEF)-like protein